MSPESIPVIDPVKAATPKLADLVLTADSRDRLAADCAALAESRIARRRGLAATAVKSGLALLKKARPDILPRTAARILPDLLAALQPLYGRCLDDPRCSDFAAYLVANDTEAVTALLQVADSRLAASRNTTAKSVYARLRPDAELQVREALPEFGVILARYL